MNGIPIINHNEVIVIFYRIWKSLLRYGFPLSLRLLAARKMGLSVGRDVYIGEGLTLAADKGKKLQLYIEDRVAIAPNVNLILSAHPNNSHLLQYKSRYPFLAVQGSIRIKHDAWIGMGATILPNVTIGEFSIVGAGAVVTKDVPPKSVVVGNPAKVIRSLDI